jgi:hypothetical protein
MKKKLFSMALLIMALFLAFAVTGCSSSSDDDDPVPPNEEPTNEETFTTVDATIVGTTSPGITVSAKKSDSTGIYYVSLTGTAAANYLYTASGTGTGSFGGGWVPGDWNSGTLADPAAGKYAAVYIDDLWASGITGEILAIKQTNAALKFYTGSTNDIVTGSLDSPAPAGVANILIDGDTAMKWKVYPVNTFATEPVSVLIWSGAVDKTVTYEIQEYSAADGNGTPVGGGAYQKIVVDYSGVTTFEPVTAVAVAPGSLYTSPGIAVSAIQDDSTGIYYVSLSGTVGAAYVYTSTGGGAGTPGGSWASGDWGPNAGATPPAGKYTAIDIEDLWASGITGEILAIKQTNAALRFYTGSAQDIAQTLTAPAKIGDPNILITGDTAMKWKVYPANQFQNEDFSVIIWDGAEDKTVTFEIQEYSTADGTGDPVAPPTGAYQKIVVDFSNLTF